MKPLHGFLQDGKWYEDLGHIFLGMIPFAGWIREWTQAKLPWPMKGQWPPGKPFTLYWNGLANPRQPTKAQGEGEWTTSRRRIFGDKNGVLPVNVTQLDRVSDVGRDEFGYEIGRTIRFALMLWLVVK